MNQNNNQAEVENLDAELHMRVPMDLKQKLKTISDSYGLGKSTLARIILSQHLDNYKKNRLWG